MSSQNSNFQAALARAKARADDDVTVVTRTYYDEDFTFTFRPRATPYAVEIIGRLTEQADLTSNTDDMDAAKLDRLMKTVTEFLDAQAAGDTSERIADLMRAEVVGIAELFDLQRAVIEVVAGRPIMSASSSPTGSSEDGTPSTDGALPAPSIPSP